MRAMCVGCYFTPNAITLHMIIITPNQSQPFKVICWHQCQKMLTMPWINKPQPPHGLKLLPPLMWPSHVTFTFTITSSPPSLPHPPLPPLLHNTPHNTSWFRQGFTFHISWKYLFQMRGPSVLQITNFPWWEQACLDLRSTQSFHSHLFTASKVCWLENKTWLALVQEWQESRKLNVLLIVNSILQLKMIYWMKMCYIGQQTHPSHI